MTRHKKRQKNRTRQDTWHDKTHGKTRHETRHKIKQGIAWKDKTLDKTDKMKLGNSQEKKSASARARLKQDRARHNKAR
jgi:hypothetical protein